MVRMVGELNVVEEGGCNGNCIDEVEIGVNGRRIIEPLGF